SHDVVVVDETSMVSLSQMAKLVEAVRPDARLVLVGDPQQLASVEAGAVLGDIVGPAADGLLIRAPARAELATAPGTAVGAGDAPAALEALGGFRLLCAHRRGPYGVATWSARVEAWLRSAVPGFAASGAWYVGRPLLVTENDYTLGLYNGDTGVVVAAGAERLAAVFERRGEVLEFSPARLSAVETVHVMTIHKSQGSQFDTVATLLPDRDSH